MSRTVNLVATVAAIRQYFPAACAPRLNYRQDVMSADFAINLERCQTTLGRWLAGCIYTTRGDDDASLCKILLPATEEGLHLRALREWLAQYDELSANDAQEVFHELERRIEYRRRVIAGYGAGAFTYRTVQFEWPVFGETATVSATTPETYFDECARGIRRLGGIILEAGLSRVAPPQSLTRTMAGGHGLELLARHQRSMNNLRAVG